MNKKLIGGLVTSLAITSAFTSVPSNNDNFDETLNLDKDASFTDIAHSNKTILNDNLNLRQTAEIKDNNILVTMRKGAEIEILSNDDSEWTKVKYGNKEGYALSQYLNDNQINAKTANNVYATTADLNVRSGAGTKYSKLGYLKKGQQITVISISGSWAKFNYNGRTAYASVNYLKKVQSNSSNTGTSSNTNSNTTSNQVKVTANSLNVRAGAGTKYAVLGTLKKNEVADVLSDSGTWIKIKYKNSYGYIHSQYTTKIQSNSNSNLNNNTGSSSNNVNNSNSNTSTNTNTNTNTSTNTNSISYFKQEVLRLVNIERAKEGLCSLTIDSKLSNVAQIKAQEMVDYNYFAHNSPVSGTPFELMRSHGITYKVAGENLAKAYTSPEEVVKAWMNSSGHRKNIMNPRFTHLGLGIAKTSSGVYYWTQMFTGQK